jgi:hypothetical protein
MAVPHPEAGLVVHFNYLWSREQSRGIEEARYPRPCAIVIAYRKGPGDTLIVMLAPITHSPPRQGDNAIPIPTAVKTHLGLDDQPSWIMVDEVNETGWPGYDLHPNAQGHYAYGFIPPRLHERIKTAILDEVKKGTLRRVPR